MSGGLTAAELRRTFDQSFAVPPPPRDESLESLILIRAGGEALALRNAQIAGLFRVSRIVPVPSRIPELLGLAGNRGQLTPVFDLAALLGLPSTPLHYAALARDASIALAFDQLQGQVAVPHSRLLPHSDAMAHLRLLAHLESGDRAVVDLASLVETIRQRAGSMPASPSSFPSNQGVNSL